MLLGSLVDSGGVIDWRRTKQTFKVFYIFKQMSSSYLPSQIRTGSKVRTGARHGEKYGALADTGKSCVVLPLPLVCVGMEIGSEAQENTYS